MSKTNNVSIPDRCCAKCGFLFAIAKFASEQNEKIFDPERIRSEAYPPPPFDAHGATVPGVISASIYTRVSKTSKGEILRETIEYTWAETFSINCYWNIFKAKHVSAKGNPYNYDESIANLIPLVSGSILEEIRKDRTDCEHFFRYYPGIRPERHAELQIEENRLKMLQRHEQKLAALSNEQERRMQEMTLATETLWKDREKRLTIILGLIGFGIAIVASILSPIVTHILSTWKN